MGDLISRQDVIDIIMGDGLYCDTYADKVYSAERIKNIPTVEPKKGEWMLMSDCDGEYCSLCGREGYSGMYYCPNCGARMTEG